ncbi:MAG TPA: hypothetical protein VFO67_13820, partial [Gemmatimonadales bacterium]|nr:hypothetical protein [Gemmatimonadales bacterium]
MRALGFLALFLGVAAPLGAQTVQNPITPPPVARAVNLSGPRIGFTALSDGVVEKLHERLIDVRPTISQFGWQFEKQF